jgi:hypothetical protein
MRGHFFWAVVDKYSLNIRGKHGHQIFINMVNYHLVDGRIRSFNDALEEIQEILQFLHVFRKASPPLVHFHDVHETIKSVFFRTHVFEQQSSDEIHSLAVAYLGVEVSIRV